jgi:phage tail-like protein
MPRRPNDPLGNFRFTLHIDRIVAAGFAECSGLQRETKVFEYKEGGNNQAALKFPETTTYGNITLKRGVSTSTNELFDWHTEVVTGDLNRKTDARKVAIVLNNEHGDPIRTWNLVRAFPIKWVGPDLKAIANEVAIETLEIAHEGFEVSS